MARPVVSKIWHAVRGPGSASAAVAACGGNLGRRYDVTVAHHVAQVTCARCKHIMGEARLPREVMLQLPLAAQRRLQQERARDTERSRAAARREAEALAGNLKLAADCVAKAQEALRAGALQAALDQARLAGRLLGTDCREEE